MKCLVTGSSGYIGSKIVDYLRVNNIDYIGIDKRGANSEKLKSFNLIDRNLTFGTLETYSPGLIIHCGTFSALAYKNNFLKSFKEDTTVLINILEFLKRNPLTRFIFFSSSYVYSGISNEESYDERAILRPEHNFGVAKLFFEQFIIRNHPNSVIFRLSSVFGAGSQRHPNAIKGMIEQSFSDGTIEVWGKGVRKMQYVHIDDVIDITIAGDSIASGIYNLGGNNYISVSKTAELIASATSARVKFIDQKSEGDTLPFMSIDKLKDALSGKTPKPFESALTQYIKSF